MKFYAIVGKSAGKKEEAAEGSRFYTVAAKRAPKLTARRERRKAPAAAPARSLITWEVAITLPLPGATWEEKRKNVYAALKAAKAEWESYGGKHLLFVREVVERTWERLELPPIDLGFPVFPETPRERTEWIEERLPGRRPRYFTLEEGRTDGHATHTRKSVDGVAWWRDDVIATGVYYARLEWYRQCIADVEEIRRRVKQAAWGCGYKHLMP